MRRAEGSGLRGENEGLGYSEGTYSEGTYSEGTYSEGKVKWCITCVLGLLSSQVSVNEWGVPCPSKQ